MKMEKCHECKKEYSEVWACSDDLWAIVSGRHDGRGLVCMKCFEKMANDKNITLYWECGAFHLPSGKF